MITNDRTEVFDITNCDVLVKVAEGTIATCREKGKVRYHSWVESDGQPHELVLVLTDVLIMPTFEYKIMAEKIFDKKGCKILKQSGRVLIEKNGRVILEGVLGKQPELYFALEKSDHDSSPEDLQKRSKYFIRFSC